MTGYQALLSEKLKETEGRSMYSGSEVRDILLDLWLAAQKEEQEVLEAVPA